MGGCKRGGAVIEMGGAVKGRGMGELGVVLRDNDWCVECCEGEDWLLMPFHSSASA